MPFEKVYLHAVWCTKYRLPLLYSHDIRKKVWNHIREYAKEKQISILAVNGYKDHCHCLFQLNEQMTFANCLQLIKGESAFWINKNGLCREKFKWQNDYYIVSVSESGLKRVMAYIDNQENHHNVESLGMELDDLFK